MDDIYKNIRIQSNKKRNELIACDDMIADTVGNK